MTLPFALADIRKVTFYKRDEVTTDLICCDVEIDAGDGSKTWFIHEEDESWLAWLEELARLPGFDSAWYSKVYLPAFENCQTIAYERPVA
ncbi:MAG: hypothetical protein ABIN83_07360 [Sphingomicrobium sp.]